MNSPIDLAGRTDSTGARLGVSSLPPRLAQLANGMIYAVAIDQQALRVALLAQTLSASLRAGVPCALITQLEPQMLIRKAQLIGVDLAALARSGQLQLVHQKAEMDRERAQQGPQIQINDLRHLRLPRGSLVVFDGADERFCLADAKAAVNSALAHQQWADAHQHTLLPFFHLRPGLPRESTTLRALAENFAGFAIVKAAEGDPVLDVRHWFGAQGAVPRSTYVLAFDNEGVLQARPASTAGRVSVDPAYEQMLVTSLASEGFRYSGSSWRIVDSLLDVIDQARHMMAGTVVLHFERAAAFKDVAQTVAALRSLAKPQLRIVVREVGARLRLGQSAALLRLGVSLLVPQEVSPAAARLMCDALRGSVFARPFEGNVARVLEDSRVKTPSGLLKPDQFRVRVEQLLDSSQDLEVPHTMIRFSLLTPAALRGAVSALRNGVRDAVCCQHDGSLWVFLFACGPDNGETVLIRLLGRRFENLLAGWQRIGGSSDIRMALHLLDHAVSDPEAAQYADTVIMGERHPFNADTSP